MTADFSQWVGRYQTAFDIIDPARSNALRAALGNAAPLEIGYPLPLLHHWLYFWDVATPAGLGSDGHPARGGFLPPVELPRRMWAGGRVSFHEPLWLGETVQRDSRILKVEAKSGRSGDLVFVTVEHRLSGGSGLAVVEEQDIVYRAPQPTGNLTVRVGLDLAPEAQWHRAWMPDPVLLFRYSALTMNGHRIHYDRPYAMAVEGYPALVVQGPLQATMLMQLALDNADAPVRSFAFRGLAPAFDGARLHVCGNAQASGDRAGGAQLWTEQDGVRCMEASVTC